MKIETKFNPNQTVYWLEESKLHGRRGKVQWISVYPDSVHYAVNVDDGDGNDKTVIKYENELYGSLEDIFNAVKTLFDSLREQL